MAFSYTGLAFLLLFCASGFLAYRFFQYWQRKKDTVSKLFFLFLVPLVLFIFITAIIGLFFANNTQLLIIAAISAPFLQGIAFGILLYTTIYLKFPRISPWIGFLLIFVLGILATFFSSSLEFYPFLESSKSINWGHVSTNIVYIASRILIILPLIGFFLILNEQYKTSKDSIVRRRALGLVIFFLIGGGAGMLDFFAGSPFIRDIGYIVLSVGLIMSIIITQKSPPKEKHISSLSSKIK